MSSWEVGGRSQVLSSHVMFFTTCAPTPVCKAISSQGYPMKAQFSAHPKQDGSKRVRKTTKRPPKEHGREGGGGENGGSIFMGPWVAGSPVFAVFLGGRATGPRAGEAGDTVGPPGLLYGASVMG